MEKHHLEIKNKLAELEKLTGFIDAVAKEWEIEAEPHYRINVALEEVFSNIVFYGYEDKNREDLIAFDFTKSEDSITITVSDGGKPFNPLEAPLPDGLDKPLEERKIGGLGIHFIRTLIDEINYRRIDGKNILTLIKKTK